MIKRFDLVKISSIEKVVWVSGPSGRPASPQGTWSVIGNVGEILFIAKDETVVQIPVNDVIKIADYSVDRVIDNLHKIQSTKDLDKLSFGEPHGDRKETEG